MLLSALPSTQAVQGGGQTAFEVAADCHPTIVLCQIAPDHPIVLAEITLTTDLQQYPEAELVPMGEPGIGCRFSDYKKQVIGGLVAGPASDT